MTKLLTEQEAAEVLNVSARTLWQLRSDGRIPCVRIGRAVRYDVDDLRLFIEEAKRRPDTPTTGA
ncbi:MAG: helix-turn-helix domain-containing protein [Planctomycetaceae bacterium]|nr:helix-turn-helix domain-containing protein [Planctomycetaceae bacterium]